MTTESMEKYVETLQEHDIRPTANRLIIMKALNEANHPLSLAELEEQLVTLDKSSIFRVLTTFRDNHLVHAIENGSNSFVYELCLSHSSETDDDTHVHFFCERCHSTFCLTDITIPTVELPAGYRMQTINYLVKGICPNCQ